MMEERNIAEEWVERTLLSPARVDPKPDGTELARELYDHQADSQENDNVAGRPENQALVEELTRQMQAGWKAVQKPKPVR